MKSLLFVFILIIPLLLISCGKKRTIHIVAKNAATGVPYASLEYFVVSSRTAADGEKYRTEAHSTLNENGEAMVELRQKHRTYLVRVVEPVNTCYNKQSMQYFDSPYDVNGTFTFEFAECGNFKLNIHNINCMGPDDEIYFKRTWLSKNESTSGVTKFGCLDFTGEYFTLPIGIYKYEWTVTRNGVTNYNDTTFSLNENQYFDFTINY